MELIKTNQTLSLQTKESLETSFREIDELLTKGVRDVKLISSKVPMQMEKILEDKTLSVGLLRKQSSDMENKIIALYSLVIKEACEMFPNSIKDEQVLNSISIMLLNEYPELKPSEIILILKNGISGKYGKMYHAISGSAIMEWALNYFQERMTYFENKNVNKGKQFDFRETPSALLDSMKQVHESLTQEKSLTKKSDSTIEKEHHDIVQDWHKEFMRLSKEQGHPHNGRFVEYEGKMLDNDEFIQAKLKQFMQKNNESLTKFEDA